MQRDPDPEGRSLWRDILQNDPVQCQTQGIRLRAVDADNAPFDRAIIAEIQHRGGHRMGADPGGKPACGKRSQRDDKGTGKVRPPKAKGGAGDKGQRGKRIATEGWLGFGGEPKADTAANQHGDPGEQHPPRRLQGQKRPEDHPARRHLVSRSAIA